MKKVILTLSVLACAFALVTAPAYSGEAKKEKKACGCCEAKAEAQKDCKCACCKKAFEAGKVCKKCHPPAKKEKEEKK